MRSNYLLLIALLTSALAPTSAQAIDAPIRTTPGLTSVSFWEATSRILRFDFSTNSSQLTTRLANPLSAGNRDFAASPLEPYDVFYSNADGTPNIDGGFITIEATYGNTLPFLGALNISEVGLNITGQADPIFGNVVTRFVALGDNAVPASAQLAIDGNLTTFSRLGNTFGLPSDSRLSLTIGFPNPISEPTTAVLLMLGISFLGFRKSLRVSGMDH